MRKKWFDLKRGLGAAALVFATAGMMLCASTTQAAELEKVRGYVNVDASDFILVHSTINDTDKYGFAYDEKKDMYKLHYKNEFTDRNNIGCTYRSSQKYDMTDVLSIQLFANHDKLYDDLLLFYVNSEPNTYYHTTDDTELKEKLPTIGNGTICDMSDFSADDDEAACRSYIINRRYSSEYVFLGVSHEWLVHDAEIYIDNSTIAADRSRGCMSLSLLRHDIELLESDKPTRVVVDSDGKTKTETYNAFSNVRLALEDGNKYAPGETGSVYRDESVTITYSLAEKDLCALTSVKFYSDKAKKNCIYEMDVTGNDNKCTFILTSRMIQDMEEKTGKYNLGDIYVEPVFGTKEATIEFSKTVVEAKDNVEVVLSKTNTDGSKEYDLREKTGAKNVIGTFSMNQAHQVDDEIAIDYKPNSGYTGDYEFSYYEYRMCEDETQSNGTSQIVVSPSEDKVDIVEKISDEGRYFWIRAHIKLKAEITLHDKETTYNSKDVKIDEATVTWPEGHQKPTGKITYRYYTDEECTKAMASNELPVNAGTYYVKATLDQDDYYEAVTSNVAKIDIKKATPKLESLMGNKSIAYGDPVSKTTPIGIAKGVTNQTLEGTFAWKNPDYRPTSVGTVTAEVEFTPDGVLLNNYTTATGTARVIVNKAIPTITVDPYTKVFDGKAVTSVPATVTGANGEATGQKLAYEFYNKVGDQYVKMIKAPVNAGTYYVMVYTTSSNAYYGYAQSDKVAVTIQKRECNLITVPINETDELSVNYSVNVYVTNTVSGYKPEGKIKLVLDPKHSTNIGDYRELEADIVEEDGQPYASYYIKGAPSSGFKLTASYIAPSNASEDNYIIHTNVLDVFGTMETNRFDVALTYQGTGQDINAKYAFNAISSCDTVNVTWLNLSNVTAGDVVDVEGTEHSETVTVKPENAGTETLVAYVLGTTETTTKSWYLFYDITVSPIELNVSVTDKTVDYSGTPVKADKASVTYSNVDITDRMPVSYGYYSTFDNGVLSGELEDTPVNAGTYYVQAAIEAQRNYHANPSVSNLTINPVEPNISIADKTVVYDGQAHELDPAIVTGIDGITKESEEASEIETGRLPSGSVSYYYDCEVLGYHSADKPVNAGVYTVTAIYTPGENDNYAQSEEHRKTAKLTIESAACEVEIDPMEMVYTGNKAEPNTLYFTGANGNKTRTELKKVEGENKWRDSEGNEYVFMYALSTDMSYSAEAPSAAGLYYVYAVRTEGGNYKRTLSNRSTLLIKQADLNVTLDDVTTTYTGDAIDMGMSGSVTVKKLNGEDITDATVTYQYYEDENAMIKIHAPTDAGLYYVQAFVKNYPNYKDGESGVQKLTIRKATPTLSNLQATDISYGTENGASELSGTATGVKGESLHGTFAWAEAISHEKRDVGSYDLPVVFSPDESAARNYTEASGNVNLTVKQATPQVKGADQTEVYNGEVWTLAPANITGAKGMPVPTGAITYTYYTDQTCTAQVPDIADGVKDAGTYYCKVDFTSDTDNYTNASEVYQIEIKKADAIIKLEVPPFGKDLVSKEVTIEGVLEGVFDEPTGTVTIYQKPEGAEDSAYTPVAENLLVYELDGDYVFSADVTVTKGTYDFKAVYNEGTKKNYNIVDGKLEDVDMSKEPQNIYFEEKLIVKEYGTEDFKLEVVDQNNGPEEVTYRVIDLIGDSDVIEVSRDGTVQIKDTGRAFVMAVKPGNENYNVAYAFAVIQITKAPTEISLSDKTVTYSGKPVKIEEAVVTSHEKPVEDHENIQIDYTCEHVETGYILDERPVEAGVYKIIAYTPGNDHYLSAEKESTLTIEKAKAKITLEADHVDEKNRVLTLQGYLPGVFDQPSGTITLYKKVSGQPDDKYEAAAENVEIVMIEEGNYGFCAEVSVELEQTYDFEAVYQEGDVENYIIEDGQLTKVGIKDVIDDQTDDEKDGSSENDKEKKKAVDTGDPGDVFRYLLLLIAAMALMVEIRKRTER